jgi:RimJ/RimL family protein N-acetyltransferase
MKKRIERIETARLTLRQWKEADIIPFAKMNCDPKVMEYFPSLSSAEESEALARRFQKHIEEHGFGPWAAELRSSGEFIGFIGLVTVGPQFPFAPAIEIGWRLAHQHWGQGLAPEGAIEALKVAFEKLNLEEVVSMTATLNLTSQRVMQKIGMSHQESDDFDHPKIEIAHPLCRHVLYRARQATWLPPNKTV